VNRDEIFQMKFQPPCSLCGTPIKKPAPGQLTHGWCAINRSRPAAAGVRAARSADAQPKAAPQPPRADVAVEAAPAAPVASFHHDLPIEPVEGIPMARQAAKPKIAQISDQPTSDQIAQNAIEYEALKADAERIQAEIEKRAEFLKRALANIPGQRIAVGERFLGRIVSVLESFDLKTAKKNKSLASKLVHYTEVIEKFDLKAARKHLDEASLSKFITARETVSLRFLKSDGGEE
jgi:hypothetical protein